ncbi:ras association domain-containing protein 2-like isoform X2 [Orbicella faveolata]|nr:ras association domain-containing protein 2-like isoform X2 [Orbicella faveolata]XP_020629908.1 ras association domain-containing protein 2-like isoform X2 [Orbicella faveolata]
MPSVYHENCGKPGPKSIDYLPPPEARIFKSRSAPNSPLLGERRPLFPRASPRLTRGLSQLSDKTAGSKPTKSSKVGRSKSFHGKAEQRNSLGKVWHPGCLRCEECGKRLNPGQHSEHRGIPYCNIPCYSLLFGPGGYGRGGTESYQYFADDKLTPAELDAIRNEVIPKLREYNIFFEGRKALQLTSKEVGGRLILEGVLKIYWGLKVPVTLASHNLSYWRRRSQKEQNGYARVLAAKNKDGIRPRTSSLEKVLARRRSLLVNNRNIPDAGDQRTILDFTVQSPEGRTTFIPPYGTSTNLRVTSRTKTREVIKMLMTKFQITDGPQKFHLYAVYDNGSIRQLRNEEFPLYCRLLLGPSEEAAKIFVMEADDSNNISHEVAQYIHFATPVLQAFLDKYQEEEEKEVERVKQSYMLYRQKLQERLAEISTAV